MTSCASESGLGNAQGFANKRDGTYEGRRENGGDAAAGVRAAHGLTRGQSLPGESLFARGGQLGCSRRAAGEAHYGGAAHEIPGIGEAIADIITKLYHTGTHPSLEKLRKEIPAGVLELLDVPGLPPEKVLRLYKELGITSLAELEAAAKEDRIKKTKGLGAALQTKILQNLAIAKSSEGSLHLHRAAALLDHAKDSLRTTRPELKRLTLAGDFRRGCYFNRSARAIGRNAL
jgi:hypothetical protein